jgi:hypothetical protein
MVNLSVAGYEGASAVVVAPVAHEVINKIFIYVVLDSSLILICTMFRKRRKCHQLVC